MPKILVVLMEQQYPFQSPKNTPSNQEASIIVRQSIPIKNTDKSQILAKATFLKNLRNKNLVKLESILEEDTYIHLQYQFVQSQNQWQRNQNQQNRLYEQMKNLANYLANIGVKTNLQRNRIGVNHNFMVKYFMGLDFEWDNNDDQDYLSSFYHDQLSKIFGSEIVNRQNLSPSYQIVPYNSWPQSQIPPQQCHDRKVSFASIPSRYNRLIKIDQQLNQMKFTNKDGRPNYIKSFLRSQSSEQNIVRKFDSPKTIINRINKKYEDRKYSGDLKFTMFANKKLTEKESDIKSQRGGMRLAVNKIQDRHLQESNQEQIETVNSKSRIQEMKYQQYLQITKSNKKYLQDFISVLEDDEPQTMVSNTQYACKSIKYSSMDKDTETYNSYYQSRKNYGKSSNIYTQNPQNSSSNEICVWKNTEELRKRAYQAIKNSRMAIKKIKSIPNESIQYH